jgi:hypothetical protein
MVDAAVLSSVIAAIGVVVGITFGVLQLRNLVKTRQAQLFMELYQTFCSEEFQYSLQKFLHVMEWKDYDEYIKKYDPKKNPKALRTSAQAVSAGFFLEGIGVLVHQKMIPANLVTELLGNYVVFVWRREKMLFDRYNEKVRPPVRPFGIWLDYLYNEIIKAKQSQFRESDLREITEAQDGKAGKV